MSVKTICAITLLCLLSGFGWAGVTSLLLKEIPVAAKARLHEKEVVETPQIGPHPLQFSN